MIIKAFIITFNESDIIRFTIKHYQKFCSEIHIYDNHSTDGTREICAGMGCIIHTFGKEGVLDDRAYLEVKNNCWKAHKDSDYVIVCDADEILYEQGGEIQDWSSILQKAYTLVRCLGFDIYSETLPINSWNEKTLGYENSMYNKVLMFNPKAVEEINYGFGCHGAKPEIDRNCVVKISNMNFRLHHMRYIGGIDRLVRRYDTYQKRMCEFNVNNKLGHQYFKSVEELEKDWEEVKIKFKELNLAIS